ncbi:hypothetical protein KI387_044431, partial [Taxus chinensis]
MVVKIESHEDIDNGNVENFGKDDDDTTSKVEAHDGGDCEGDNIDEEILGMH